MCGVPGCDRAAQKKGLCGMHYQRMWKHGSFDPPGRPTFSVCIVDGCVGSPRSAHSDLCEKHYMRARRGVQILRDESRPQNCQNCGVSIDQSGARVRKFCSERCGWLHKRGKPALFMCEMCGKEFVRNTASRLCGDPCQAPPKKMRRRYRSDAAHRARAKKLGVEVIEGVDPMEVFERDGWACKICGGDTMRDAPAYHPMLPVMDHVIPLGMGGAHSMENIQTAHFQCNAIKAKADIKAIAKVKRLQRTQAGERSRARRGRKMESKPMKGSAKMQAKGAELAVLQKLGKAKKLIWDMARLIERGPLSPEDVEWFLKEAKEFE
ncbi:HNH endonuclease [bacterium]|nr:HNH endonuclease [bacterium]